MGHLLRTGLFSSLTLTILLAAPLASATPNEQNRQYGGGGKGPVVFSVETHARGGNYVCEDCHAADGSGLFEPTRYEFKMKDHNSGKYCWACHDGKQAERNCNYCHY